MGIGTRVLTATSCLLSLALCACGNQGGPVADGLAADAGDIAGDSGAHDPDAPPSDVVPPGTDGGADVEADAGSTPPDPPEDPTAPPPCEALPGAGNVVRLADEGLRDGDAIDAHLREHFRGGNTVIIPAGEYRWSGTSLTGTFSEDAVLCGEGEAVLRAPDGNDHNGTIATRGSTTVRLQNLTLRGVAAAGKNRIAFQALDRAGRIEVINVSHPDGSPHGGHPSPIGFYVRGDNAGEILFKDCYVANFPNNGIYISDHSGRVVVDGCVFRGNLVDNLRMDGNDVARNLLFIMDGGEFGHAGRGIRFRYPGSPTVENVHFITSIGASPIQTGSPDRMAGDVEAELRNIFIQNDGSAAAINMQVGEAMADNVHIVGTGNDATRGVSGDVCRGGDCQAPLTDIAAIRALAAP